MNELLRLKIQKLPDSPGCYLMKSNGQIIYVGKAKNLKNRVRSYFQTREHTPKVAAMVEKIDDFDVILVDSNLESLILECNLIKLHKPYYNILLKDDKHYPYLRVNVAEDFPRVEMVRRVEKDGARYFGPYMGGGSVREVLDVLRQVFPLRTCAYAMDRPRRPCLHHQIGQCLAPCAGLCTRDEYHLYVDQVVEFLSGKSEPVLRDLRKKMQEAAAAMRFEQAGVYRDRIRAVEGLMERQKAIDVRGGDQDILAVHQDGLDAMVQVLFVRGGHMIGGEHFALERAGDLPPAEVLESFIPQFYEDAQMIPSELIVESLTPGAQELERYLSERRGAKVTLRMPQRGTKHQLVEMAHKNAKDALEKRNARLESQQTRTVGAAKALGEAVGMAGYPRRIEGYDISNTQGVLSVASMVVFIDGMPAKKEYRHFRIKTVVGANDFASMNEVITRRFEHAKRERAELEAAGRDPAEGKFTDLPDLILIDGGPEQLDFARRAMLKAGFDVPIFGLAKRLEEIFLPGQAESILLDRHSPALHLIQRVRDEAHRFGITHHRNLRGKASIHSQLEDIPGIGPTRRRALLNHFRTVAALREASVDELCAVQGMSRPAAEAVRAYFDARAQATGGQPAAQDDKKMEEDDRC